MTTTFHLVSHVLWIDGVDYSGPMSKVKMNDDLYTFPADLEISESGTEGSNQYRVRVFSVRWLATNEQPLVGTSAIVLPGRDLSVLETILQWILGICSDDDQDRARRKLDRVFDYEHALDFRQGELWRLNLPPAIDETLT